MQTIEVFQSLWAMTQRRPDGIEWPLERQFQMIQEAGFDGVDIVYGDIDVADCGPLLESSGLGCTITAFPQSVEALQPAIEMAVNLGAQHLNIIGKVYPKTVSEGVHYVENWQRLCHKANLPVCVETHRDSLTTDLYYTLALMDAVPDMQMCADLSHFVVSREFTWPITELVHSQIHQILNRSMAIQGRVASREQIQLQISFDHHREWLALFLEWWEYGIATWRQRSAAEATLNFLCELGPPEYAMTGRNGKELSDRWEEALIIKQHIKDCWGNTGLPVHQKPG